MAHKGVTILVLFLGLTISTVLGINGTDPKCSLFNVTGDTISTFNLTVSPEMLSGNTDYDVHLEGHGNVTVVLEAISTSGPVGNWSKGNISCNGSPLYLHPFENGNKLLAKWKSPENVTSVNITAHIHDGNSTSIVSRTLHHATNLTTMAPNTANSTAHTATTHTATTVAKTTSGSTAVQTSLQTIIQILGLLSITNKYLF